MPEIVQEAKAKTHFNTLNHLKAEILIDTLGDTLAEREAKTFATHREMCRPTPWSKRWLKR